MTVLTSVADLLRDPAPVLLDVRWQLGSDTGRDDYLAGHLPGAVFVDLDTELSAPASPQAGRHPLPSVQSLQAAARRWGISAGSRIVVYDAGPATAAARAWWLLRWAGLGDVTILDGGLAAWTAAGGPVEAGDVVPVPGDVRLTGGAMPVLTIDEAAALPGEGVLLDARAGERYRGDLEPIDPRAGHVPGAVNAPTTANVGPDGRFRAAAVLRRQFAQVGAVPGTPVGVYCGSGITAAHEVAALAHAGIAAALWPGSWSQWANDPTRPAATGP
ncbi:sulfurtransferase [Modestobacter roseus]|uniref:Thiosulfate/3-mercaptopyruvate sulfurtransferase n=1 Tax=Modestobacter roseus TaxID=1181884 RepID=A0A562IQV5_9ACTN|nr:sulfurtransferase [Modestobacter roseus]MQA32078.1 sulfurtransferase [Modestobacter roseus]TWH73391.1 thiosulfate/3-mercaptopyruvate sulfurtransferase [Modestobacter roseus]